MDQNTLLTTALSLLGSSGLILWIVKLNINRVIASIDSAKKDVNEIKVKIAVIEATSVLQEQLRKDVEDMKMKLNTVAAKTNAAWRDIDVLKKKAMDD
jgi:hypothetical protein